jgi:hypothetical protein
MKSTWLIVVGIVALVLVALAAAGNTGRGQGPVRWEYGVFRGDPVWSWYGPSGWVDQVNSQDFARAMGTAWSTKVAATEANVLNSLGEQGWEVVAVAERSKYILRRPK